MAYHDSASLRAESETGKDVNGDSGVEVCIVVSGFCKCPETASPRHPHADSVPNCFHCNTLQTISRYSGESPEPLREMYFVQIRCEKAPTHEPFGGAQGIIASTERKISSPRALFGWFAGTASQY